MIRRRERFAASGNSGLTHLPSLMELELFMAKEKAVPLRIDEEVWNATRNRSDEGLHSLNAQIKYALRESLRRGGRVPAKRGIDKDDR